MGGCSSISKTRRDLFWRRVTTCLVNMSRATSWCFALCTQARCLCTLQHKSIVPLFIIIALEKNSIPVNAILMFVCMQSPQNDRSVNRHRYAFPVILITVSLITL